MKRIYLTVNGSTISKTVENMKYYVVSHSEMLAESGFRLFDEHRTFANVRAFELKPSDIRPIAMDFDWFFDE